MSSIEEILEKLKILEEKISKLEETEILLEVRFKKYGTSHDGHCSDHEDEYEIDTEYYTETYEIDKEFVEKYIDEDDELVWSQLDKYSFTEKNCRGSGYCKTEVRHEAVSGKLIEVKELKKLFLSRN